MGIAHLIMPSTQVRCACVAMLSRNAQNTREPCVCRRSRQFEKGTARACYMLAVSTDAEIRANDLTIGNRKFAMPICTEKQKCTTLRSLLKARGRLLRPARLRRAHGARAFRAPPRIHGPPELAGVSLGKFRLKPSCAARLRRMFGAMGQRRPLPWASEA